MPVCHAHATSLIIVNIFLISWINVVHKSEEFLFREQKYKALSILGWFWGSLTRGVLWNDNTHLLTIELRCWVHDPRQLVPCFGRYVTPTRSVPKSSLSSYSTIIRSYSQTSISNIDNRANWHFVFFYFIFKILSLNHALVNFCDIRNNVREVWKKSFWIFYFKMVH